MAIFYIADISMYEYLSTDSVCLEARKIFIITCLWKQTMATRIDSKYIYFHSGSIVSCLCNLYTY